jgi:hypothetical protein
VYLKPRRKTAREALLMRLDTCASTQGRRGLLLITYSPTSRAVAVQASYARKECPRPNQLGSLSTIPVEHDRSILALSGRVSHRLWQKRPSQARWAATYVELYSLVNLTDRRPPARRNRPRVRHEIVCQRKGNASLGFGHDGGLLTMPRVCCYQ